MTLPAVWFIVLAVMLTTYAVLDGFDFGAGIVHFLVAKDETERRHVFAAIGPFWDGNEVWLIASGAVYFFAFPRAYAAAFSGLYLPLMLVLWLVILRGLAIELRAQLDHPLWRRGFDTIFAFSSGTLAIVLGVALGNVVRGVPLDATGYFHEDLFGGKSGALDVYTVAMGVFAFIALAGHGATFLAWKTSGALQGRCFVWARHAYEAALFLGVVVSALTLLYVPGFFQPVTERVWIWPLPVLAFASGAWALRCIGLRDARQAFLASSGFLALLLVATASALFPTLLRSTVDPSFTIDVTSASGPHGLEVGLYFWVAAIGLATAYLVFLFRTFRGKADGGYHDDHA